MILVRRATPEDNGAMVDLHANCPQGTDLVIILDRSPDFFNRSRPYEDCRVYVAEEDGRIIGTAECAIRDLTFDGRRCRALYEFGFMVDPAHRRKGIATRLQEAIEAYAAHRNVDLLHLNIVEGNEPSVRLFTKMSFKFWKEQKVLMLMVYKEMKPSVDAHIRSMELTDTDDVVDLINDTYYDHDLFQPFSTGTFMDYVERLPFYNLENIFVAERDGEIKACLGYWEYDHVIRFKILNYAIRYRIPALMMRFLGLFTKVPRIPKRGDYMSQLFLVPMACKDDECLCELVKHVNNIALEGGVHFLNVSLDKESPLLPALSKFMHNETKVPSYVKPLKGRSLYTGKKRRMFMDVIDI